jgi:hypothetical protein
MNGLEIDPESKEFKSRMLNLSTYLATLIHETLDVASVYTKYIMGDDRDMSRNSTCVFESTLMRWGNYNVL